jgi:3-oxoacyl-[acyl-carrier-protein] synthase II
MKRSRVVITGLGCVTPMGPDVARTWEGLIQGRSAVDFIKRFDASGFPTKFAAEIQETPDIVLPGRYAHWSDPKSAFAAAAAAEAMADAGLKPGAVDPFRFGVSVGAEVSRPDLALVAERLKALKRTSPAEAFGTVDPKEFPGDGGVLPGDAPRPPEPGRRPEPHDEHGLHQQRAVHGDAVRILRRGDAEVMLAGGTDRLVEELMVMGFGLLGALSQRNDDPRPRVAPSTARGTASSWAKAPGSWCSSAWNTRWPAARTFTPSCWVTAARPTPGASPTARRMGGARGSRCRWR